MNVPKKVMKLRQVLEKQKHFLESQKTAPQVQPSKPRVTEDNRLSKRQQFKHTPIDGKLYEYIKLNNLGIPAKRTERGDLNRERKKLEEKQKLRMKSQTKLRKNTVRLLKTTNDEVVPDKIKTDVMILKFEGSANKTSSFFKEELNEVAFWGRSNVGKSSLLNCITESTLARVSSKPGLTQSINWFRFTMNNLQIRFIDLPG